ncbi:MULTISPECIES: SNF2-related protein [unclassified Tolypothrix]|uniref:SNF2-related protein n=1 Tax=unclassified Tolypothrix TaxID=2649714 RepID=UPI0005EAA5F6|nr:MULTISPECIES: SNF2-related protein [unclassified Tolypothrix]BAY93448.1 protein splicing site [Microchaete diplosiphon NIES-3275]EKE99314.1 SNF family helicase/proton [Tolypothrix sp. PCC 7601]MBE9085226.1 helicase [Tolypothrix sp. LEGE 11397]UYD27295.1 helicase [Tolypothrix sp. PCC 7712]UYD36845.1 helicase [Tolypothrix sp. PCC 7601]
MAILHGIWLNKQQNSSLFIWGETWRSAQDNADSNVGFDIPSNPLAMAPQELSEWLRSRNLTIPNLNPEPQMAVSTGRKRQSATVTEVKLPSESQIIALPTQISAGSIFPLHSAVVETPTSSQAPDSQQYLHPWQVEGFCLNPNAAMKFLASLPLSSISGNDAFLSGDLRFWSQVARWSLDLISRCKFLPHISKETDSFVASWQVLLDSAVDGTRLEKFSQLMPLACRTYQESAEFQVLSAELREQDPALMTQYPSLNLPLQPQELLLGFLNSTIDAQVREMIGSQPLVENRVMASLPAGVRQWLQSLTGESAKVSADAMGVDRLQAAMNAWTMPLQYQLTYKSLFRTCFELRSPEAGESEWKLVYYLQAADDSEFLVDAATIWQHPVEQLVYQNRTIEQPQETFLRGLGLASRLYPAIAPSLESEYPDSFSLNPIQAYEFIKSVAWRLEDSGLGVVLPPSLANREGWANRLGLKITAETPNQKQGRLGLQSLLNFQWKLAIGGQTISKAQFDRLVALNSPLVEINGEWVELRPQDIKTAQAFFASRKEKMSLSLEDALRLGTGDTQAIEKLPVVSFEASGALQELIGALTNNQAIAPLPTPANFKGELRPYQQRGAAWLAFLERWGLGACLADDMGLGKCVAPDTLININGSLLTAEAIWTNYASETEFDGEGFWTVPTKKLLVNSIDNQTGKIVQAEIQHLYRQQVRENLRKVTLQDGSSITITYRHKLLTNQGWTNDLKVGDYVCVPAKMLWNGQKQDPDLVKFLAWQIAEGHELTEVGRVTVSQKDIRVLENLLQIFHRLGKRYNLKINSPNVCTFPNRVSCLRVNSQAYRRFLEGKGYVWGKLSAEKSIPSFIMQADSDSVRLFLQNYFDAESAVVLNMGSIEIATASALLIQQLSTLLRRFGIWLRISTRQKCATNGTRTLRTYYIGVIGGNSARRFLQEIGFSNTEKQQKLITICQRISNTNVEGIPAAQLVAQTVSNTGLPLRHLGMHNNVYINGSQQFSRDSLQQVIAGMNRVISGESQQQYQSLKPSKWTNRTLEAYSRIDVQQLSLTQQSLQRLLDQEVFYCKIENIEDIDYEGWVYDLEVRENHNFVANNIICHNTIQFIAFLLHLKEQDALEKPTLLVCPTSVLGNWEREVKRFAPTLKILQYHGDKRPKGKAFTDAVKKYNLVVTSYSLIHRDLKSLQSVEWQAIVLDEAQNVKNSDAKQSQAVRQIEAAFRIALTGTPVENRLQELWSILDFLNPGYLGNKQFFQRRFAMPIEKYGDSASLNQLRSLVQPFILRRLKTDRDIIQDLPEKQEMTVFCGLTPEQATLYQKVVEESLAEIDTATGLQRRGMILALLIKLKQVCNHPAQYLKAASLDKYHSGKLQRLDEMLEEALAEGDRALIFTQFAEWGKLLKPHLEKQLGREIFFLYGSTSKKQREEMIDRFQHDPQGPPIMILSLKAGGVGLNLTRANHVFHFDRWWNPAVENQATDRVFRIGQTRNVQVHKFVCTGTLEEKIHDMIESKKQLAEQVVGAGEDWLTELDTDQLRNLLLLDRSSVIEEDAE